MLTDIIHFGIYYSLSELASEKGRDVFRFSAGMAILSLLLKPASCFFVYQMYRERGGDYNVNFGEFGAASASAYFTRVNIFAPSTVALG